MSHGRLWRNRQTLIGEIAKKRRARDSDHTEEPVRWGHPRESKNREPDDRQVGDQGCDRDLDARSCSMTHAVCHHEHEQRPRRQSSTETQHDAWDDEPENLFHD